MQSTQYLDAFLNYPSFFDLQLGLEVSYEGVFANLFRLCSRSALTGEGTQMHC